MGLRGRGAAIVATVVTFGLLIAGGVVAASRSSDERALQPTRHAASQSIERRVNNLLARMTVAEKLQ